MPNLELSFHVHSPGFRNKTMRRGELIGHRDKNGQNNPKFTPDHLKHAYETIKAWMKEYNAMIDKPEPIRKVLAPANKDREAIKECDIWVCPGECKCHD